MKDSITPTELANELEQGARIKILDVRRREDRVEVAHPIPNAEWKDPEEIAEWRDEVDDTEEVVVYCVKGAHVCKEARDVLREHGKRARILEGGIRAWCEHVEDSKDT